jgi:hypothetical protein
MQILLLLIMTLGMSSQSTIQNEMKNNIFEIQHAEFGEETFEIKDPTYNLYKTEDGIWEFIIKFETSKAIKRAEALEEVLDAKPNFEATAILSPKNLKLEAGSVICQKEGYDHEREEHLSNIYYFTHESVENLEVKIIEFHKDWIIITAKAKAVINGSNGHKPDADLFIHKTKFQLDKELEREIM